MRVFLITCLLFGGISARSQCLVGVEVVNELDYAVRVNFGPNVAQAAEGVLNLSGYKVIKKKGAGNSACFRQGFSGKKAQVWVVNKDTLEVKFAQYEGLIKIGRVDISPQGITVSGKDKEGKSKGEPSSNGAPFGKSPQEKHRDLLNAWSCGDFIVDFRRIDRTELCASNPVSLPKPLGLAGPGEVSGFHWNQALVKRAAPCGDSLTPDRCAEDYTKEYGGKLGRCMEKVP